MKKIESTCIIDDDPIFIYGTKRIMKEMDFCDDILVFNNGQDAIDGLMDITAQGKKLPSVIFLDLNMPIMDGWEFLEDFVKIPNHNREKVTVYIISSSVDPRDVERVKDYDVVNNYILKPITPQDLQNVLAEVA
ncbi:response regulator [Maribacter luteus]|uniref:Response regulator n=1 Tax=Maribacter luteus TaxID=2594478 RepID=A0A6I2MGP4_9FLAO|nr:response regulator [Maribacter luteus]MRX62963.1 response regulator [Maribacter luteus]|tara:strand:+ start:3486 stop:3887 length:402 start_codon:yes stop_codon:yes gene_type:complete